MPPSYRHRLLDDGILVLTPEDFTNRLWQDELFQPERCWAPKHPLLSKHSSLSADFCAILLFTPKDMPPEDIKKLPCQTLLRQRQAKTKSAAKTVQKLLTGETAMKASPLRYIPALCLIIPLTLIVASCSSSTDSTTSEDSAPEDSPSEDRRNTQDDKRDSRNLQSFDQNRTTQITADASDSTTSKDAAPEDSASENRRDTQDDREDSRSDSQNNQEFSQENNNPQSNDQNKATQITAGDGHTCALRQTGTITCWGLNVYGQLGNGQSTGDWQDDSADSSVPVEVLRITDATQITAGGWRTCALRQTGTITCWGLNVYGQLGNGQSGSVSSVPVEVLNITDATQITAGYDHTCALRQTGTITCWGLNVYGQLGNGQSGSVSSVPVEVLNITDTTQITAGGWRTCALRQAGSITCWGNNEDGQLGNDQSGDDADSSVPVEVLGITDATQITAGDNHTCALRQTGTITCWGRNWIGQPGNGAFLPQDVVGFGD